jgi:N-acetyl-gamma-glutamylphosphate reductase
MVIASSAASGAGSWRSSANQGKAATSAVAALANSPHRHEPSCVEIGAVNTEAEVSPAAIEVV